MFLSIPTKLSRNISLEVWSTESSDEVNLGTAIQLTSSIRAVMTDVTDTFEVAEGVEAANQLPTKHLLSQLILQI